MRLFKELLITQLEFKFSSHKTSSMTGVKSRSSTSTHSSNPTVTGDIVDIITDPITVGVLLDEFPNHNAAKNYFLEKKDSWWIDRARFQLGLTTINLVFRPFSSDDPNIGQLVLPQIPALNITFKGPATIKTINGHTLLARTYVMNTAMICLKDSAQKIRPCSCYCGGKVAIPFTLPVDP